MIDPHRQYIWKFALERFWDNPWVGNGIDQLNSLPGAKTLVPGLGKTAYVMPSHPHNWFLEILAETGLVGLLPMLIALGFVAWRLGRRYHATQNKSDLTLLLLMTGFWTSALLSFSIWAVWWQLTFLILFAIVAADRELETKDH
ncbi:MAG: O-antigen ligase family protein [Magnetovibrio sp.]|nr:O-antigen ligase family protein [Magnetovibrio sp.]